MKRVERERFDALDLSRVLELQAEAEDQLGASWGAVYRDIIALHKSLTSDEHVERLVQCTLLFSSGLLAATNSRLVFVHNRFFLPRTKKRHLLYTSVANVVAERTRSAATIKIFTHSRRRSAPPVEFNAIEPPQVAFELRRLVDEHVAMSRGQPNPDAAKLDADLTKYR